MAYRWHEKPAERRGHEEIERKFIPRRWLYPSAGNIVLIRTKGKKKRIVERERREMYDYLDVGDRVDIIPLETYRSMTSLRMR